jgi:hypothetical protein
MVKPQRNVEESVLILCEKRNITEKKDTSSHLSIYAWLGPPRTDSPRKSILPHSTDDDFTYTIPFLNPCGSENSAETGKTQL